MRRSLYLRLACVAGVAALALVSASSTPTLAAAARAVRSTAPAAPARALIWSKPQHIAPAATLMTSVSCASPSFCMAMDSIGNAFTWNGRGWSGPLQVGLSGGNYFVSCPTSTFCSEINGAGYGPGGGDVRFWHGQTWSKAVAVDPGYQVTGFTCASGRLCVVVDNNGKELTWNGTVWVHEFMRDLATDNPTMASLVAVSCVRTGFCLTISNGEDYLIREGQEGWSDPSPMESVEATCAATHSQPACLFGEAYLSCPSSGFCLVVDNTGRAISWNGQTQTWAAVQLASHLNGIACATPHFCVAVDQRGRAYTWNGAHWSVGVQVDHGPLNALTAVSCPTAGFCLAVDTGGDALIGRAV